MVTKTSNHWPGPAESQFLRELIYELNQIQLGAGKRAVVPQRSPRQLKALGLTLAGSPPDL